jgi:hypothetical protein
MARPASISWLIEKPNADFGLQGHIVYALIFERLRSNSCGSKEEAQHHYGLGHHTAQQNYYRTSAFHTDHDTICPVFVCIQFLLNYLFLNKTYATRQRYARVW